MSRHRNEFLVGLVILVTLAVVVAGALWLSEANIGKREADHVARFRTVGGMSGDLDPVVRGKDGLQGLGEQAVIVADEHPDPLGHVDGGLQLTVPTEM